MKEDPDRQVLPELPLLAGTRRGISVGGDRTLGHGRRATADCALDVVLDGVDAPSDGIEVCQAGDVA